MQSLSTATLTRDSVEHKAYYIVPKAHRTAAMRVHNRQPTIRTPDGTAASVSSPDFLWTIHPLYPAGELGKQPAFKAPFQVKEEATVAQALRSHVEHYLISSSQRALGPRAALVNFAASAGDSTAVDLRAAIEKDPKLAPETLWSFELVDSGDAYFIRGLPGPQVAEGERPYLGLDDAAGPEVMRVTVVAATATEAAGAAHLQWGVRSADQGCI